MQKVLKTNQDKENQNSKKQLKETTRVKTLKKKISQYWW